MSELKPFKTIEEQVEILKDRGLVIEDDIAAQKVFHEINYYRLSGYTLTLRRDDRFYEGVKLGEVLQIYKFDCKLRTLIMHSHRLLAWQTAWAAWIYGRQVIYKSTLL